MSELKFSAVAANENHPQWELLTRREAEIYDHEYDIRTPYARDHSRLLHSMAYRRLKHKTQVFFNIDNDHICTRMEHVSHVDSVSSTIAKALGLNDELTKAIATGHDLGHAPFGHQGEVVIRQLTKEHLGKDFWHEQNGLRFVDDIELLEDTYKIERNLNLTYAVRDGILSHCGEVDKNGLFPRDLSISIEQFTSPGQYEAVTWEGCVVKMADKIAYVGRDIEDAIALGILGKSDTADLMKMARIHDENVLNTTVIMHGLITDICRNSSPENGIRLSPEYNDLLKEIKDFNYQRIYGHPRLDPYRRYSELVLHQLFDTLFALYDGSHTWEVLADHRRMAPSLIGSFEGWLAKYCVRDCVPARLVEETLRCDNKKIYDHLQTKETYAQAVIDYIAGMTDRFAITLFNELLQFGHKA